MLEYVSPEKIEAVLSRCSLVSQVFVHGDSSEAALVAVVVPDNDAAETWARAFIRQNSDVSLDAASPETSSGNHSADVQPPNASQVCKWLSANETRQQAFHKDLLAQCQAASASARLLGYEIVKALHVELSGQWSPQDGMLTPTLKLKRAALRQRYKQEIIDMYKQLHTQSKSTATTLKSKL